jgi:uncharacterized protein DUF6894
MKPDYWNLRTSATIIFIEFLRMTLMTRFYFHIHEYGFTTKDEDGREFLKEEDARKEALDTGASLARDAFITGSVRQVVIDVREEGMPFLRVSFSLDINESS